MNSVNPASCREKNKPQLILTSMKNLQHCILLVLLVHCVCIPAISQTNKGKVLVGGNTSFSFASMKNKDATDYYDLETSKAKSFDLTPEIGLVIVKNLAFGLSVRYSSAELKQGYQTFKSSSFYALPFVQLYLGRDFIKAFVYGSTGLGNTNDNETGYGTSFDNIRKRQFLYETGGGIAAFFNEYTSFEFGAAYSSITSRYDDYSNTGRKDNIKGIGFKIGIVLCL
jgi:hypothetical protein